MRRIRKIKPNWSDGYSFAHLSGLKDLLLSDEGCPWDKEQTLMSLKEHLKEEANEVAQAVDRLADIEAKIWQVIKPYEKNIRNSSDKGKKKLSVQAAHNLWERLPPKDKLLNDYKVSNKLVEQWEEAKESLREEIGDLIIQPMFESKLAERLGYFTLKDVLDGMYEKLVRRHPHIFGSEKAQTPKEVLRLWHEVKTREKNKKAKDKKAG